MNSIKPREILPDVRTFCAELNHIALLDYMLQCNRVDIGCCLPMPPPLYDYHQYTQEQCVKSLKNHYMRMVMMLNDSLATDRERLVVQSFAPLISLQNFLPKVVHGDVVRMPVPPTMDHKDYVYLIKECDGYYSDLKDYLFFISEEDRDKFQKYLWEKYPQ